MSSWVDGPFLAFDTETTGVRPDTDRIVSAALVRRGREGESTHRWLIDPGLEIPAMASAVHGITTEAARRGGRAPADALDEIADAIAGAMGSRTPVVAFNAAFDLTLLGHELARHGRASLEARLHSHVGPVLDPLVLDRALDADRLGNRRLADLCAIYGVLPDGPLHNAEVDARVTLDLLAAIAQKHPEITLMPVEQVHTWQGTVGRAWAERRRATRPPTVQPVPPFSASSSWAPRPSSERRADATP